MNVFAATGVVNKANNCDVKSVVVNKAYNLRGSCQMFQRSFDVIVPF